MSVGNDVIDLNWNPKHGEAYFRKLRSWAFALSEQKLVADYPTKVGSMILWSIKEAAYKSSIKCGNRGRFVPEEFHIELVARKKHLVQTTVTFSGEKFKSETVISGEVIHSVTILAEDNFESFTYNSEKISSDNYLEQSEKVRNSLAKQLNHKYKGSITFSKDNSGIPNVLENGNSLKKDISFSHHGHVVAYAMDL